MQSLSWYLRRLRSMSPREVVWRAGSAVRDRVDRFRVALGRYPSPEAAVSGGAGAEGPWFRLSDLQVGEWAALGPGDPEAPWRESLLREADLISRHRFSFFNLQERDLGTPIDWNRDHASGRAAPMSFSPSIDYRQYEVTGDAKLVWEPNRHQHLVVLGRAYRASGAPRYAAALVEQLESWLQQCPFMRGMNWRSPLELAIRLINWVWAVDLIQESGLVKGPFRSRLLHSVYLHLWEITRKYSRGSSANNHLIGEAAGVFIASGYFRELADASRWHEESREILSKEILAQTYPDGCGREQALGYLLFVLQFFLFAGVVARQSGRDFSPDYWSRLENMLDFLGAMGAGGDQLPMFGDCDDGYVLDLGAKPADGRGLLSAGAVLFGRSDFKALAGGYREPARWLLGRKARESLDRLECAPAPPLSCRAFPDSGYYLLQCGRQGSPDRISLLFDCGELGFKSIAAHGHADSLSFTLRAFGVDVLVDPGTYDYFTFPAWREYFRSTRAHNTVVIDGEDQSVMSGAFMWSARARSTCLVWEPGEQGGRVSAEHDGYTRLADPVLHRRTLELDGSSRTVSVRDDIVAREVHEVAVHFHVAEDAVARDLGQNRYEIRAGAGTVTLELDRRLSVDVLSGSDQPIGGWVSRGYHRKARGTTLIGRIRCGETSLFTTIKVSPPAP